MDISIWIILWIIFLVVQNVAGKKKSKRPPQDITTPPDFEIPTLENDSNKTQAAEVQEINLNEIYPRKKFSSEVKPQNKISNEVEQKNFPLNLNSSTAMNAIILSEILGKPKSKR